MWNWKFWTSESFCELESFDLRWLTLDGNGSFGANPIGRPATLLLTQALTCRIAKTTQTFSNNLFPNSNPCLSAIASLTAMLSVMSANKIPWRRWCHGPAHSFHGQWESVWPFSRWWKCLLTKHIKEWRESARQKASSVHCCSHQHSTHLRMSCPAKSLCFQTKEEKPLKEDKFF